MGAFQVADLEYLFDSGPIWVCLFISTEKLGFYKVRKNIRRFFEISNTENLRHFV